MVCNSKKLQVKIHLLRSKKQKAEGLLGLISKIPVLGKVYNY